VRRAWLADRLSELAAATVAPPAMVGVGAALAVAELATGRTLYPVEGSAGARARPHRGLRPAHTWPHT